MEEKLLEIVGEVNQLLYQAELDADVEYDEGPTIIVSLKKSNDCFSSENMGKQFANDLLASTDGMGKSFMDNYTTLNDMELQLRVIGSIANLISEDIGMDTNRIYLGGENIIFEFIPDEDLLYQEEEEEYEED
jgi:hypothetical protein